MLVSTPIDLALLPNPFISDIPDTPDDPQWMSVFDLRRLVINLSPNLCSGVRFRGAQAPASPSHLSVISRRLTDFPISMTSHHDRDEKALTTIAHSRSYYGPVIEIGDLLCATEAEGSHDGEMGADEMWRYLCDKVLMACNC